MTALGVLLALALAGCAAPPHEPEAGTRAATAPTTPSRPAAPAGAVAGAKPASATPAGVAPASSAAVQLDRSCNTSADCVVKDVGSCCGAFPACVNRNSPTDPQGVRARCSEQDRASVCGFNEITSCSCVRNQCVGEQEPVGGWMDDPPPPPPADR